MDKQSKHVGRDNIGQLAVSPGDINRQSVAEYDHFFTNISKMQ